MGSMTVISGLGRPRYRIRWFFEGILSRNFPEMMIIQPRVNRTDGLACKLGSLDADDRDKIQRVCDYAG
jgi:hypothetical protein